MIRQSTRHGESMKKHCEQRMQKIQREYKNVAYTRDLGLLRVIQVWIMRQSVAAEMHRRGMVH